MKKMKKMLSLFLLGTFICCLTIGCSNKGKTTKQPGERSTKESATAEDSTEKGETKEGSTEDSATAEDTTATKAPEEPVSTAPLEFSTEKYSFVLPNSWTGLFYTEETDEGLAFYNRKCREAESDGFLFWISESKTKITKETTKGYYLGTKDKIYYDMVLPTGAQYDEGKKELKAEYTEMFDALKDISKTFEFK